MKEVAAAQSEMENRNSPRRLQETNLVREPAFAAWIVSLCPDASIVARHRGAALEAMVHYAFDRLRFSQFFALESAWERFIAGPDASPVSL
ncbi:MAG: hypothetical protein BWZ10_00807 [candidate division BRC1 bacterium ADurb.BinA364]|nr:MAG: hypothetical protein BWZ10_00807 [candidate division BRC1 bacterium ADurb.BinA364]